MTEDERKMMAFLAGMLRKIAFYSDYINSDDWQQLDNICYKLGLHELDENEFRY